MSEKCVLHLCHNLVLSREIGYIVKIPKHKKVLLRERKRYTARRVASPWQGGGVGRYLGVPPPPVLTWLGGGGGLGTLGGGRYLGVLPPPHRTWPGGKVPWGTPPLTGWIWPVGLGILDLARVGTPSPPTPSPSPPWSDRWHVSKHYVPVVLRTRAVKIQAPKSI